MTFEHPLALLLLVPAAALLWWRGLPSGPRAWLRGALVAFLIVALAGPSLSIAGEGTDLVVVVDRSRSMPPGSDARAEELIAHAVAQAGPHDRVGVVSFGAVARVERSPQRAGAVSLQREPRADGTDLAAALDLADQLIPRTRAGRVLVISDGLVTEDDPRPTARRLGERGIPVDHRHLSRAQTSADVAVEAVEPPPGVRVGEPFQIAVTLRTTAQRTVRYELLRGETPIARGTLELDEGANRFHVRDRLDAPALTRYSVRLLDAEDDVPENDRAHAFVRAGHANDVLVVRSDGVRSALADALASTGGQVRVTATPPTSLAALDGVALLVLENVPASELGETGLRVVSAFVREAGGGLLVTGGRRAFGQGGYHRSALEEVLPVTLELREEQRRTTIALGISMDRSGSMSAPTADGRTKMTLAADGAAGALELLGRRDAAAVWVVDTRAHTVLPLTNVEDGLDVERVRRVTSQGGGIYIEEALSKAADELRKANQRTRHLILFADAADSEQPGDYKALLEGMRKEGITVSVIGLGSDRDPDAALLEEIAKRGGGRSYFAESADELPRLFSEETIVLARAAFVDEPTPVQISADLAQLGAAMEGPAGVGGYNLAWARPLANVALRSGDEHQAPLLAFAPHGAGRVAALLAEADGPDSGALRSWRGYRSLFARLGRWLLPPHDPARVWTRARREGRELVVEVELEEGESADDASALLVDDAGQPLGTTVSLQRLDRHRLQARFPSVDGTTAFPLVRLGDQLVRAAPVTLPWPAEFEPRDPAQGRALLRELATLTGGLERLELSTVFEAGEATTGARPVGAPLVTLAALLLLAEVAVRRLRPAFPARRPRPEPKPETPPAATPPAPPAPRSDVDTALEAVRRRRRQSH